MLREEFLNAVRQAGVVGQGGAGFPSHVKYAASVDVVIANGCECEPLLGSDLYLLEHEGESVVSALGELVRHSGATRGVVAVKKKHVRAVRNLTPLARQAGLEVVSLDDFYPAGDEHVLVREVTGRTVPPLGLPSAVGAMVTNIGTLRSVKDAMGGAPLTARIVTVTGEVRRPCVLRVPLGTPVEECIAACGGAVPEDYAIVMGGPMMGRCVLSSSISGGVCNAVVTKTSGSIIVLPARHALIRHMSFDREVMRRRAKSACIQCRLCTDMCPRYLLGHGLEPHRIMRAFAADAASCPDIIRQTMLCCECGVCEKMACPMELAPRQINALLKQEWRAAKTDVKPDVSLSAGRDFWRSYRKIPAARLVERLRLGSFKKFDLPFAGMLEPDLVRIPLQQHIGAAAEACCAVGAKVKTGDLLGDIPATALGARVHASIAGTVISVDSHICIRRTA